uniref:RE63453p n=1 Tax=Drosophila melanogaster TaxID=7227 RepID=Q86P54_DROME|nr:RE63453p [Drosophila melanogaster]
MLKSAASSLRRRRPKTTITATLAIEMPSQPKLASLLAVLVLLCYCDSCFFCYAGKFSSSLCFLFFCVPFSFGSSFFFTKTSTRQTAVGISKQEKPHRRQHEKPSRSKSNLNSNDRSAALTPLFDLLLPFVH